MKITLSTIEHVFDIISSSYSVSGAVPKTLSSSTDLFGYKILSNDEINVKLKIRIDNIIIRIADVVYNYDLENTNFRMSKVEEPGVIKIFCHNQKEWKL